MSPDRRAKGRAGEDAACAELSRQGFEIVERNWRVREGEVDVIARRGDLLVFAEVKSRTGTAFGAPEESVTPAKARRLRSLAAQYLATGSTHGQVRFDVFAVMLDPRSEVLELRHIPDAF
jgi:putative endonuclease